MFLSYKYTTDHGFEPIKDNGYKAGYATVIYQFNIFDTDFDGLVSGVRRGGFQPAFESVLAVIETYRKRDLPVVPNIIRCMLYTASLYSYWTIEKQIEYNRKYNAYWSEYEEEINKYLLLM
jgi:hypothetical protein